MSLSIRNARVIDPATGLDQIGDVHVDQGRILALGEAPSGFQADEQLDASGLILAPGLVDLDVALCEPGLTRKGNVDSENPRRRGRWRHQPLLPAHHPLRCWTPRRWPNSSSTGRAPPITPASTHRRPEPRPWAGNSWPN